MINLLPPFARRNVLRVYWQRVTTLVCFSLSIALVMVAVMHLTVYFQLTQEIADLRDSVGEAEALQTTVATAADDLVAANTSARRFAASLEAVSLRAYIQELEAVSNNDIRITSLQLNRAEDGLAPIRLSGVAGTRQALITFLNDLEAHQQFGAVAVPFQNFSQSTDIEFSIQLPVLATTSATSSAVQ